jgi:hypothetical protein
VENAPRRSDGWRSPPTHRKATRELTWQRDRAAPIASWYHFCRRSHHRTDVRQLVDHGRHRRVAACESDPPSWRECRRPRWRRRASEPHHGLAPNLAPLRVSTRASQEGVQQHHPRRRCVHHSRSSPRSRRCATPRLPTARCASAPSTCTAPTTAASTTAAAAQEAGGVQQRASPTVSVPVPPALALPPPPLRQH